MGMLRVDGTVVDLTVPEDASVGEAFEAARNRCIAEGRIIADVQVDGVEVTWNDGSEHWTRGFGPETTLDLRTDTALAMSTHLLQQIHDQLPSVAEEHRKAAKALRSGPDDDAIQRTINVIPWWKDLHEALNSIFALHQIETSDPLASDIEKIVEPASQQAMQQLTELRDALDDQHYGLVADLLEMKLAPLADQWQDECEKLSEVLKQRFSTDGD